MRFFLSEGEKIEKFGILRENFPNSDPNQKWLTLTHHFFYGGTLIKLLVAHQHRLSLYCTRLL